MAVSKLSAIASGSAIQTINDTVVAVRSGTTDVLVALGSSAAQNTDVSGANVPLMNGANTWSALQTYSAGQYLSGGSRESALYSNGNSGTGKALNLDNGNYQAITITGAAALTQTTPTYPGEYTLIVTQDGTGHVYHLSGIKWVGGTAPSYSSAANKVDIFRIIYDGTNYWGKADIAFSGISSNYLTAVGVQQFSITIASGQTTGTAVITAVGSGAFIMRGGCNPSVSSNGEEISAYLTLTNSTTITATRALGTAGTVVVTGSIIDADTTNLVKSVQYGTITLASGDLSNTATISAVTDANAAVQYLGYAGGNTTGSYKEDMVALSQSGTTVTATRTTSGALTSMTVGFCVIEFQGSALASNAVQRVSATSSSSVTSWAATINAVVMANTVCFNGGAEIATVATSAATAKMYGVLTNTTTFTANVNTASANAKTFNASVVEFKSGVLQSAVQRGTTTLTTVTSNTSTLSPSVVLGNSALSWLGNTADATFTAYNSTDGDAVLTNGTTVTVSKNSSSQSIVGSWEVFEFVAFA